MIHHAEKIWLLRHSETEWSRSGQHTSRTDLPLTEQGVRDAEPLRRAIEGLRFSLVLSSPLRRAYDTCRLVGLADSAVISPDLKEWDYGVWEGRTTADIRKEVPDWSVWTGAIPEGETVEQVGERCGRVIAQASAAPGEVALFGHGHCLRILAACWLGLHPRDGRLFALGTGSISVLGFEHDRRVIRRWNVQPVS